MAGRRQVLTSPEPPPPPAGPNSKLAAGASLFCAAFDPRRARSNIAVRTPSGTYSAPHRPIEKLSAGGLPADTFQQTQADRGPRRDETRLSVLSLHPMASPGRGLRRKGQPFGEDRLRALLAEGDVADPRRPMHRARRRRRPCAQSPDACPNLDDFVRLARSEARLRRRPMNRHPRHHLEHAERVRSRTISTRRRSRLEIISFRAARSQTHPGR